MDRNTPLQNAGAKGTAIGNVRGLGAAHEGAGHWLQQRFTAIGNLMAVSFLLISFILLPDYSYLTVRAWLSDLLPAFALALLIVSTFWHARLGLAVMIEDYVDDAGNKFAAKALLNIAIIAGAGFGLFSIARIALAGTL